MNRKFSNTALERVKQMRRLARPKVKLKYTCGRFTQKLSSNIEELSEQTGDYRPKESTGYRQ